MDLGLWVAAQACPQCGGAPFFDARTELGWGDTFWARFNRFSWIKLKHQRIEFERAWAHSSPMLRCRHCGRAEELAAAGDADAIGSPVPPDGAGSPSVPAPGEEVRTSCPQCGAETAMSPKVLAEVCDSCGSTLLRPALIEGGPGRPAIDGVLPLTIDEKLARKRLMQYASWRRVPLGQLRHYRAAELTLTFLPYVVFTGGASVDYVGRKMTRREREGKAAKWKDVSGHFEHSACSSSMPASQDGMSARPESKVPVPPLYGGEQAVPFRADYLAGARGLAPDRDIEAYRGGVSGLDAALRVALGGHIGGKDQDYTRFDATWRQRNYQMILAPVYTASVPIEDTTYKCWVDGTTGIAHAEAPGSWLGLLFLVLSLPVIVAGVLAALFVPVILLFSLIWLVLLVV